MQKIFLAVIDMSIVSSLVILAVLLVRALLKRAPRRFAYVLWAAVLLRLLCPFAVESPLSLIPERAGDIAQSSALPESEKVTFVSAASAAYRAIGDTANGGRGVVRVEVGAPAPVQSGAETQRQYVSASHGQVWLLLCAWLWPAGTAAVLVWGIVGQIKLRRMLVGAVKLEDGVWLADHIPTAFVMGLLRPNVYLPSDLDGPGRDYVLEHERAHIRRGDHITRLLAFAALALHWFNPLVWLAFAMSGRDMEMSCDEAVMRRCDADIRADYCQTLLDMSANKHFPSPCLLAFGESDTGARVRNALSWKKPAFWAVTGAVVLIVVACVLLLTNPTRRGTSTVELSFPAYQNGRDTTVRYDAAYDIVPFTVSVALPKGWTAEAPEELRVRTAGESGDLAAVGCELYTPVQLYDEKGNHAGFVGWSDYEPYEGDDVPEGDYYKTVYYSLRLGAHYGWTDYEPLKSDEYTETATATVFYQTPVEDIPAAAWPQHTAPGVCHYDKRLNVYVAIQLDAGAATEKEILAMADSIAMSVSEEDIAAYADSNKVKVSFPGYYEDGNGKAWDTGAFVAAMELPAGWTVSTARNGSVPRFSGVWLRGFSSVYLYDADDVYVGEMSYLAFDPEAPAPVVRSGSWTDADYARVRYCNELYRSGSWRDYETVAYTDTAETFRASVKSTVDVNDMKGYHRETLTGYGIGRYDTGIGAYVIMTLDDSIVSDRNAALIAESLELYAAPISSKLTSVGFGGWDYSDGTRRGTGDFLADMYLPEGWSVERPESRDGLPDYHDLLNPAYIYDENGNCAAYAAWGGFDPTARLNGTADENTSSRLRTLVFMELDKRTDWVYHTWTQFNESEDGCTMFFREIGIQDVGLTDRRAICVYSAQIGSYVVIEFTDGRTYDWAAQIIAENISLQGHLGIVSGNKNQLIERGYNLEDGLYVECKPYTAKLTLPDGWSLYNEAPDNSMSTAGLTPWYYMYDAAGNYAGFIASRSLTRPIVANHYVWEYDKQVLSGETEVYTTNITYDVFDESLLPGYAWNSFDTVGLWVQNEALDTYIVVQFVPGAIYEDDLYDMALSITLEPETVYYVPYFAGVDWGTDRQAIEENFDYLFMEGEPLRARWSVMGHDCTAYYSFDENEQLNGGYYSFNEAQALTTTQEKMELYNTLLAELTATYGQSEALMDKADQAPENPLDPKTDKCGNGWTKQNPYGGTVGIHLLLETNGDIIVRYTVQ